MSIQVTLLGKAPKKALRSSAYGNGGGGNLSFIHLAWSNDEKGLTFTKDNRDPLTGLIQPYKYLGICSTDDTDDEILSFNNYTWTYLCPCGSGGDSSTGDSSIIDDPNYKPELDPSTKIDPQIIDYVKPECVDDNEMHVANQEYHLVFSDGAEQSSIGYSLDLETTPPSVTWNIALHCQEKYITIKVAYDWYDGWIYYADFYEGFEEHITLVYTNLNDYLTRESDYQWAHDGKWHRVTFEENPLLYMNTGQAIQPTKFNSIVDNGAVSSSTPVQNCQAEWDKSILNSAFGKQKMMRIHEAFEKSSYWSVYDSVIKYRWKSDTLQGLLAQLPEKYEIRYKDLSRQVNIVCNGVTKTQTYIPSTMTGGSQYTVSDMGTKQGARVEKTKPTWSGWQSQVTTMFDANGDIIYVRFYNGYSGTWFNQANNYDYSANI